MKSKRIIILVGSAVLLCICALSFQNRIRPAAEPTANTAILKLADSRSQEERTIVSKSEPGPIANATLVQANAPNALPSPALVQTPANEAAPMGEGPQPGADLTRQKIFTLGRITRPAQFPSAGTPTSACHNKIGQQSYVHSCFVLLPRAVRHESVGLSLSSTPLI